MSRLLLKIWVVSVVCSLIVGVWIPNSLAQQIPDDGGIKLTISPEPINLSAKPGQTITHQLRIRNSGNKEETLVPRLLTFTAQGDSGKPRLDDPKIEDEYLEWVSFSPKKLALDPQEWGTSTMTIQVPSTAAYGYYFAVSWGRDRDKAEVTPAAASLIGSVAQLVLLEVPAPGIKRQLAIESFEPDGMWHEFLPITFSTRIKNSGNIHAVPFGNIFISDGNNTQLSSISVNREKGNVLPDSSRVFATEWREGFPVYEHVVEDGKTVLGFDGKPISRLKWDISNAEWWRFGKYTASLVLAYNNEGKDVPLTATASFWVIPWRLIIVLIAIPTIPAAIVYWIMKKRHAGEDTSR